MSGTGQLPELESLRTQLADVARELAERDRRLHQTGERDRELQDLREQSRLLLAIAHGTAGESGQNFFAALVNHLTSTMQVQYAVIGEVLNDPSQTIRTIAVSSAGSLTGNFAYPLAQTPCETVLNQSFACFESHVQHAFPRFTRLTDMGVDSYCGVPIRTKDGTVIGLLAVMDTKRLQHTDWLHSLLTVFATRAGAELQRQRAEQAQREAERRLRFTQFAIDRAVDGVLWADDSGRFIYANEAVCRSLGYSQDELLSLRINDIAPDHDSERFRRQLETIKQDGAATYESLHRRKDGTEVPVEVSISYLEHEGNGYTCGTIRDITERKRIEQERRQALADLQNITETVPDIMFTLDTAGNLIRWNSRLALVTEYEPDSLLNKSALTFVPVEEQTQTAAAIQRAFTEGYAELDGHLLTKTGRTIPYHWTGATLKDAAGRVIGITGIGRDVSEQKRVQLELTRQRRHLLESQTLAHLGSCEWEIASDTMIWSDEQFRIFGHAPQSIAVTHDTFLAALLPDDHDRVLAAMNEALLGKAPYDIECRIVRPTGEIRTIHCRGTITRNQFGHPVQMSGTVLDITERKRIDDALADSERRYRAIFETMPDPLFIMSFDGVIRDANPAACLTYGYTRDEFTGLPVEKMIDPQSFPHLAAAIEAVEQGRSFHTECLDIRKDGTRFPVDVKISAFVSHGEPVMLSAVRDITERKRMEEALRRSRTQLSDILENNPAVVYTRQVGNGWPHTFITPNIYQLLGYTSIDIIGRPELWDSLMHEEDLAELMNRSLPALLRTGAHAFVARLRHRDGSYRWIENQARLTHLDDGPLLMVGTMTDITVRMGAEQALRESEARNRSILESVLDAVVSIDERGGIIGWNAQAEAMFGYSAQDVLGLPLDETIIPARYRQAHAHGMNRMLQKGDGSAVRRRFEFSALHRDGHEFPVEFAIASTQIGGHPTFSAFIRDITERKRAEEALHASEERFRAAYHNASVGISICDLTGRLQEVNQALCEILGYSQQELLAKDFQSLTHPDDLPGNLDRIRGLLTGTIAHQVFEKRYVKKDGGTVWTQVGLSVIRSQDDTPSHLLAMVQDITERKLAEEAVRESEKRLRQAVLAGDIGIFDHDHQSDTIYWSPEQRRIYGWNPEEPVTLAKYLQHVHEEDREWIAESVRRAHDPAGDGRFDVEHRIIDRQGALHWLNTKSVTFFEGDGPARRKVRTVGAVADITERKRAEEVVTRSHDLMKLFVEHTPAAVAMLDNDLRYVAVSRRWLQDYRLGDQDLIGRHHYEVFPEISDKTEWPAIHQRCLNGAVERREDDRFVRADGSEDWLRWEVRPWQDVTGHIGGIIMFTEVVTERKRAEKALRETNDMLQALIETSPLAIIGLDQQGTNVTCWNPAAERIFGWRADEVLGHPLPYIPAEDEARSLAIWEETTHTGVLTGRELRRLRKDGSLIDLALWSTALQDAQGVVTGTFSFIADITDRKRTEEALKRSERQLRTVLDSLPIGVWFTDEKGHVLYGNPVGQQIWADAARVGLPQPGGDGLWWETVDTTDSLHRWAVGTVLARGHDVPNEMLEIETHEGDRRTIRNSAVPVKDDAGEILGAIVLNEDITDRVRAEQALRQEHGLLMAVMDAATDIIFVKDIAGRYIHMNRAGARTLGMAVEDVIGWNEYALWPSDLAASCQLADRRVLETGEPITVEETSVNDGKTTIYLTTKAPYHDPEGRIIGIIGVARDITERKQAEEALRSSEERFAKAFRSSPYPIVISEVESGLLIDANDAAFRSFGYRREEAINRTSVELRLWPTPDHRRRFVEHLQQAGAIRNLEMDLRMQNGDLRHCLLSAELIELHGKRCMVTVGSDITEQKRAEQNLQRSHAFIRQIIDTDPNFIFAKDRDGRFILVNKAVAEAYGTTVDKLIGKTDADFNNNAEEVAFFLRKDRDVMERLQDQFIPEERITDATGTVRWLQTVKRPILDESGHATMVLGASTDITERKQMEEALRQRERDLRAAIDERERISQDLHDGILQSLYAVGLGLEACKPLMTQRHYKKAVATMSEAIGQLNHVMSEVRNFIAGLESQVLQGSTFPAALQEMVSTLAATHPLRCTVSVDDTAAGQISTQQALHLLNIVREALSNSLRHAQATKATVTLKPLSRCLRLSIVDNGIGFEPTGMRGVGHGLTNMAARARKVGGRFAIKSAPQHGTRITIDVPKENNHAESESAHGSTAARR